MQRFFSPDRPIMVLLLVFGGAYHFFSVHHPFHGAFIPSWCGNFFMAFPHCLSPSSTAPQIGLSAGGHLLLGCFAEPSISKVIRELPNTVSIPSPPACSTIQGGSASTCLTASSRVLACMALLVDGTMHIIEPFRFRSISISHDNESAAKSPLPAPNVGVGKFVLKPGTFVSDMLKRYKGEVGESTS